MLEILNKKLGIRTISGLIDVWEKMKNTKNAKEKQISLFKSIGILGGDGENFDQAYLLFENIWKQGTVMQNNHLAEKIGAACITRLTTEQQRK